MFCFLILHLLLSNLTPSTAARNGRQTPVMGWSGYNRFMQNSGHCDKAGAAGYNETTVVETMNALVSSGLSTLGYIYINLDDCWIAQNRTQQGDITADATRFPHGMKWLAEQAHSRNLKLGLYEAASVETCRQFPGSQGNEERDAATLAGFGADFVKLDSCSPQPLGGTGTEAWQNQYLRWSNALKAANPNIIFSCSWPVYYDICVMKHGNSVESCGVAPYVQDTVSLVSTICHQWRYDLDLKPTWTDKGNGLGDIIKKMLAKHTPCDQAGGYNWTQTYRNITGNGAFNDPDFLIVGCATDGPCEPHSMKGLAALSDIEQQTQMTIWCVMSAPLIIGSDVRSLSTAAMATLSNQHAIEINQDPFVRHPFEIAIVQPKAEDGNIVGWGRRLHKDGKTVALAAVDLRDDVAATDTVRISIALTPSLLGVGNGTRVTVRNVWNFTTAEMRVGQMYSTLMVGEHSSVLLLVSRI